MRILLDTCMNRDALDILIKAGHDVVWAHDWPEDPGDEEILHIAHMEQRALITLDKDSGSS